MKAAAIPVKGVNVDEPTQFMEQLKANVSGSAATVQAVDAQFIADLDHLWAVIRQAWMADKQHVSRAKFDIEILLRIACDSRVTKALATVGLKKGRLDVIFVIVGEEERSLQLIGEIVSRLGEEVSENLLVLTPEKEAALRRHHHIDNKTLESTLLTHNKLSGILAEKAAIALLH